MQSYVGIDFGTTNSAIAVAGASGPPQLLELPGPGGDTSETWRSVLYFEPGARGGVDVSAGSLAIARYLETGGDGRLVQSIKSHLASKLFRKTGILQRNYALEDLIAAFLLRLREAADRDLGSRAVVGRPVRYWGAESDEDDQRAVERMHAALALAGFTEVVLEPEPSAAAARLGADLTGEELVLIADFGGGTSDFSLLRMAPDGTDEILGIGGLGIGGDTFDGCIVDEIVAPSLGKGSMYSDAFGAETEVPRSLYVNLRRWHHLAFLKSRSTMALLERVHGGASEPEQIERFVHVIEHDLGLPLHRAVERAKIAVSSEPRGELVFRDPPIDLVEPLERADFEDWIASDLDRLDQVVDEVLAEGGVRPDEVTRVFTTGGTSFVPAVRQRLAARFPGRLTGGGELTSVALGLAEKARRTFG